MSGPRHPRFRRIPPVRSPIDLGAVARRVAKTRGEDREAESLEALLKGRFEADAALLCGSGTQALQLALTFARDETGRATAALPAYTCYDVASAAVGAAVRPVFYDLDPDTLAPDPDSLAAALADRPAALVAVHHFGLPTPMEPLRRLAREAGSWLIEDAAQGHGGLLDGRPLGSLAPLSVLSFGRGKGWTGGGGGVLLLRGRAGGFARAIRARLDGRSRGGMGSVGRLLAQWLLGRPSLFVIPATIPWLGVGETRYRPPVQPVRMRAWTASAVLANDAAAQAEAETRRTHARWLRRQLEDRGVQLTAEIGDPAYLRLPVRVPGRTHRNGFGTEAARLGILPAYPMPLPELAVVRRSSAGSAPTPGAGVLADKLFTVPTHSHLGRADLERIVEVLGT